MESTILVTAPLSSKRPPGTNWDAVTPQEYPVLSCKMVYTWGSEPGEANIVYSGSTPITVGSAVKLSIGNYFFSGACERAVPLVSSRGRNYELTVLDYRKWLDWDKTYCAFNKIDDRLNPATGYRQRRYLHVLPWNYGTYRYTWTTSPYTAAQIIELVLTGPGIETPWRVGYLNALGVKTDNLYHPNMAAPVYEVDCMGGKSLSVLLNEVCEEVGCQYTLMQTTDDLFRLVFAQRGVDGPEVSIPAQSDNRTDGLTLSNNPTRVRVLGDRNLYQVHDVVLEPDWKSAWNSFYTVDLLTDYLFKNHITWNSGADPDQVIARMEARDLAMRITVAEFAALTGNANYLDYRKYGGRCRNFMPAALYIQNLLFRCFRVPTGFWFRNTYGEKLYADSLEIQDKLLTGVSHDPTDGFTIAHPSESVDGNAYVIVKGYQLGKDMFESIRPERFNITKWTETTAIWQKIDVRIEDAGEPGAHGQLILFDEPVIQSSDLLTTVDGYSVFNAQPTITVPPVRATLTFAGEKFSWYQSEVDPPEDDQVTGLQNHDAVLNVGGLNGEFVLIPGLKLTELLYADNMTCRAKAIVRGNNFLKSQWTYSVGAFQVPFGATDAAYKLHGKVDRVSVDYSPGGAVAIVERTSERQRMNFVPERDLDRMRNLRTLLPGQAELRRQADSVRKIASTVRASKDAYKMLADAFKGNFVEQEKAKPAVVTSSVASVPAGSVFVKNPTTGSSRPVLQKDSTSAHTVFAGVTVRQNEPVDATKGGEVKLQAEGYALALVGGPVSVGDSLVTAPASENSFLVKSGELGDTAASMAVGTAQEAIATASVKLIKIRLGAGGGGTSTNRYRGTWDASTAYAVGDIVRKTSGGSQGVYVCVIANTANAPTWPEPTDAGTCFWEVWAFGPATMTRCVNNADETLYINAIPGS